MKKTVPHKGFAYTLFVISFLSFLMLFLSMQNSDDGMSELAEKIRADEVISFANTVSNDVNRGAFISGKRALLSLDNSILEGNGSFPEEANLSVVELIINGTFNNGHSEIMENSTLVDWTNALKAISAEQRMNAAFLIESAGIFSATAFEVAFKNNISAYISDPFTKIAYNKTIQSIQAIPINGLEDPYVSIKSIGTLSNTFIKCNSLEGTSYAGVWTFGKVYSSNESSFPADPVWRGERILVTNGTEGKDCNNFKGVVVEAATDDVICTNAQANIKGAANAVAISKTGTYAIISDKRFWLANGTSCYFESPEGPSFLDRLEGRDAPSAKYLQPGVITGLGALIQTFDKGWCLDYKYYYDGSCF